MCLHTEKGKNRKKESFDYKIKTSQISIKKKKEKN